MDGLANYLTTGRERAGMTLEDVAAITRIPVSSLKALEEGRIEDLPAPAYVRGFVIAYCRTVGLDPEPALAALADYWRTRRSSRPARDRASASEAMPVGNIVLDRGRETGVNWTYLAIVIVFMVGILVAILTVGTGAGLEDVSRVMDVPKVHHVDPVPHG